MKMKNSDSAVFYLTTCGVGNAILSTNLYLKYMPLGYLWLQYRSSISNILVWIHCTLFRFELCFYGCFVIFLVTVHDDDGDKVALIQMATFVVGAGGFGGKRSSDKAVASIKHPNRQPDTHMQETTCIDQVWYDSGQGVGINSLLWSPIWSKVYALLHTQLSLLTQQKMCSTLKVTQICNQNRNCADVILRCNSKMWGNLLDIV